jgi:hypothetical protein
MAALLARFIVQFSDRAAVDDRYDLTALDGLLPVTFAVTGMLIGSRRSANPIGWLFLFSAAWGAFGTAETSYLRHAFVAHGTTYIAPAALQSSSFWSWVPAGDPGRRVRSDVFPDRTTAVRPLAPDAGPRPCRRSPQRITNRVPAQVTRTAPFLARIHMRSTLPGSNQCSSCRSRYCS